MSRIKMKNYLLMSLLLTFVVGCMATGTTFKKLDALKSGDARLVIYRPPKFYGGSSQPFVYLDGVKLNQLKNGGIVEYQVPIGKHNVKLYHDGFFTGLAKPEEWSFVASEGEEIFFRFDLNMTSLMVVPVVAVSGTQNVVEVEKEVALKEMQGLILSNE